MILNKNVTETDTLLNINNDIYRMMTVFNDCPELKKLLANTDVKPLQGPEITKDLRDKQISRVPLLPYNEEEGSIITITMVDSEIDPESGSLNAIIAIDVYTPGNQWVISEGIRPLQIAYIISNLVKYKLKQTDGVKYRLTEIINSQLSDVLLGYRMVYETVVDE